MIRSRNSLLLVVFVVSVSLGCAGCATIPSMSSVSGQSQNFVSAAKALTQAESDYFDEIQAASDAAHQLRATVLYVQHNGSFVNFKNELQKKDDFNKAKQARLAVMKQLQNYAQVIAAIMSGANATWIASDASSLMADSNKILADAGAQQLSTKQAGMVTTVVTKLGQAVISAVSAKEIQALAQQAKGPIKSIANMVNEDEQNIEKDMFAPDLGVHQTNDLLEILKIIYNDKQVNSAQRFAAVQTIANWKPAIITKGQAIEAALAKLESANDALAKKQKQSAMSLAKQAYALAAGGKP